MSFPDPESRPNYPIYRGDTAVVILCENRTDWPYLIKRFTDGRTVQCDRLLGALVWAEGVVSSADLPPKAKRCLAHYGD